MIYPKKGLFQYIFLGVKNEKMHSLSLAVDIHFRIF